MRPRVPVRGPRRACVRRQVPLGLRLVRRSSCQSGWGPDDARPRREGDDRLPSAPSSLKSVLSAATRLRPRARPVRQRVVDGSDATSSSGETINSAWVGEPPLSTSGLLASRRSDRSGCSIAGSLDGRNPVAKPYSVLSGPPCWVARAIATFGGSTKPRRISTWPSFSPVRFCSKSPSMSCSSLNNPRSTSSLPRGTARRGLEPRWFGAKTHAYLSAEGVGYHFPQASPRTCDSGHARCVELVLVASWAVDGGHPW